MTEKAAEKLFGLRPLEQHNFIPTGEKERSSAIF